jgi:transcriptional regulator with XRE-family HTH domain
MGSPTLHREELGSRLRRLRDRSELSAAEVAERLGCHPSKISRLESGQRGIDMDDLERLFVLYQVSEEQRDVLTDLASKGNQPTGWRGQAYKRYIELEADAASISDFGLAIVPGLFQTPDYARAILRASVRPPSPKRVEKVVQGRVERQQLLSHRADLVLNAILDESVLHRVAGNAGVMLAQLRQLIEMSRMPGVTVRVVPFGVGVIPAGVNKFLILRLAKPEVGDVVLLEDLLEDRYIRDPEVVRVYSETFRMLTSLSADPDSSRAMIISKAATYESMVR